MTHKLIQNHYTDNFISFTEFYPESFVTLELPEPRLLSSLIITQLTWAISSQLLRLTNGAP